MTESKSDNLAKMMMITAWENENYKIGTILKGKMMNDYSFDDVRLRLDSMSNVKAIIVIGGDDGE